jgi:hypothetical protein
MSSPRVNVQIDRLVLRGVDPLDQRAFADSLQAELKRTLALPHARAGITGSSAMPNLRLGKLALQPGAAGAKNLAAGVARRVAAQISGKGGAR